MLGIGASSSAAYTLRKHYTKNLLPFECKFDRGGIDPGPIIAQVEAGSKKKSAKTTSVPSPGKNDDNAVFGLLASTNAPHPLCAFLFFRIIEFARFVPSARQQ